MKRVVFLIIASLMVLGLVLPGCGGGGGGAAWTPTLWVAVVGPLTDFRGQGHLGGAQMARDEINSAGGVNVNGTMYRIGLVQVETQEQAIPTPAIGTANLVAAFDANPNITFCVGGFRTEAVFGYREVAMDANKLFMDCGAATGALQFSVVSNYAKYKYWFKSTPYNESFLVKSLLKMTRIIGAVLNATLYQYWASNAIPPLKPAYQDFTKQRVAILMENAAWCEGMKTAAQLYLPAMGFHVVGTWIVAPAGAGLGPALAAIGATAPHIILTAFSGSVGALYSAAKIGVPGMTVGINVPGQQSSHWGSTGGACLGEIMLDTWAEDLSNAPTTVAWFNAYLARFGRYPVYTAAAYDAIKLVCRAIEDTDSFNSDDLVAWLENPANIMTDGVASPKIGTYPWPGGSINSTLTYLTDTQVYALYPNINNPWVRFNLTPPYYHVTSGYWMYDWLCADPTSSGPHIAHDLVYGPGYATGIGSQWQNVSGAGKKVGIWPTYLGPAQDIPLTDQYGCWNFAYPGTKSIYIPVQLFQ